MIYHNGVHLAALPQRRPDRMLPFLVRHPKTGVYIDPAHTYGSSGDSLVREAYNLTDSDERYSVFLGWIRDAVNRPIVIQSPEYEQCVREAVTGGGGLPTTGDFPAEKLDDQALWFHRGMEFQPDLHWQDIFEIRNYTSMQVEGFSIKDVIHTLVAKELTEGETFNFGKVEKEATKFHYWRKFGAGIQVPREFLDDNAGWYDLRRVVMTIASAYWRVVATYHYDLVSNAVNTDATKLETATTDTRTTLNRAMGNLKENNKEESSGFAVSDSPAWQLYFKPTDWYRIEPALSASVLHGVGDGATSSSVRRGISLLGSITPHPTSNMMFNADEALLVLPGGKLVSGLREDLKLDSRTEFMSDVVQNVGRGRLVAAVERADQIRRIPLTGF